VSYSPEFYDLIRVGSTRSAQAVVPEVLRLVRPRSVIDLGCGTGAWLAEFARQGIEDVYGVDGPDVRVDQLEIAPDRFEVADLTQPVNMARTFDLVISLEVAEHLPETAADTFVASLVSLGAVILFSAAVPHQGGVNHLNEQWPRYWAERFGAHGYVTVDALRATFWDDERVEWWYAQNMLFFVAESRLHEFPELASSRIDSNSPRAIAHPGFIAALAWDAEERRRTTEEQFRARSSIRGATRTLLSAVGSASVERVKRAARAARAGGAA
jgi:SAM-dependent methyltransferase